MHSLLFLKVILFNQENYIYILDYFYSSSQAAKIMRAFFYEAPAEILYNISACVYRFELQSFITFLD